ncbi:hypothetical protein [Streptomyces sp. SID8016]|nr:hypothetical protein [Streptomyces sp. SID8016]
MTAAPPDGPADEEGSVEADGPAEPGCADGPEDADGAGARASALRRG